MLWRRAGILNLTVIVKARFKLIHEDAMKVWTPEPLRLEDQHLDDSPVRSLRAPSDLVPYRPRCDVLLTGFAHAPSAGPVLETSVRLGVQRGSHELLNKSLRVLGDRKASSDGQLGAPEPFTQMPLAYEHALRGDSNPMGVRRGPNIIDDAHPDQPAGFGPISPFAAARKKLLSSAERRGLKEPIPELSPGFCWDYYQTAPADQQIPFLQGDETIVLEHLDSELPRIETKLPGATAEAFVTATTPPARACLGRTASGAWRAVKLVADTLFIDAPAKRGSVTWRVSLPIDTEQALPGVRLAAGVALPNQPLKLPEVPSEGSVQQELVVGAQQSQSRGPAGSAAVFGGTRALNPQQRDSATNRPATPFAEPAGTAYRRRPSPAGISPFPARWERKKHPSPPTDPQTGSREKLPTSLEATQKLRPQEHGSAASQPVAPFQTEPESQQADSSAPGQALGTSPIPGAPIPGAPWSDTQTPTVPTELTGRTMDLSGTSGRAIDSLSENQSTAPSTAARDDYDDYDEDDDVPTAVADQVVLAEDDEVSE